MSGEVVLMTLLGGPERCREDAALAQRLAAAERKYLAGLRTLVDIEKVLALGTASVAWREIGAYGSSLISEPATIGIHSSSSSVSERIMRVFAWPRRPSRMKSCRARIAFCSDGNTVRGNFIGTDDTGRALIAIRDHPIAASAMGINVSLYKSLGGGWKD